jgi:signal transduction histidine kinase
MPLAHSPDDPHRSAGAEGGGREETRILVVDDQATNLDLIDTLLTFPDCRIVRAQSAEQALLALLHDEFAVIILDIMMPGMNGLELAELIKQRQRTRDVPILFLTAHMVDEIDILRGYTTGAVDYITKPFHADILRSKVAVFVELYRTTRALRRANASLRAEIEQRELLSEALVQANHDLERRVRERTDALERADRRKDEFLASLAHELRNPLAPIRAAAEVLEDCPDDTLAERARQVLVRQVDHMSRLIDDLLDVSRITNDKLVLQTDRIELAPVVAAAVETSRPLMEDRGHELTVTMPPGPVALDADPARLAQVLSNLLTNAAKYTAPGGRVQLCVLPRPTDVLITVRDNGIGIRPDLLPRVFDLFTQGDPAPDRAAGGLGIGLTLARRLVEMHGGTLEARSDGPGRGSEFAIRLPISAASLAPRQSAPAESAEHPLPTRRILVVDDNEDAAVMLSAMLGTWGQLTCLAHDGLTALDMAREFRPDVVLLDIGLPRIDGYETARRLREEPWGRELVIAAVTGWGQVADIERSRQAGFDHHLVKPVNPRQLRALIALPN